MSDKKSIDKADTVDKSEIKKFEAMANEWWDEEGKFKPLHRLNPTRIEYIVNNATQHFGKTNEQKPLAGLTLLDVGCGGGLLSEPMARLGAQVTAIDASEKNINIASLHAKKSGLDITYMPITTETLVKQHAQFDIVLNMEVVEHVADIALYMQEVCALVKPSGLLFNATLNRTLKSYLFAIIGAEYVLRWLPMGTHDWQKFVKPSELSAQIEANGLRVKEILGMTFNPLNQGWSISDNLDVNYLLLAQQRD